MNFSWRFFVPPAGLQITVPARTWRLKPYIGRLSPESFRRTPNRPVLTANNRCPFAEVVIGPLPAWEQMIEDVFGSPDVEVHVTVSRVGLSGSYVFYFTFDGRECFGLAVRDRRADLRLREGQRLRLVGNWSEAVDDAFIAISIDQLNESA